MRPVRDIAPGIDLPEVTLAKGQAQYRELPVYRDCEGVVVTRWRVGLLERLRILFRGHMWLTVFTFHQPLSPLRIDTRCPLRRDEVEIMREAARRREEEARIRRQAAERRPAE